MSVCRYEHARALLDEALDTTRSLDPALEVLVLQADARLECLERPTRGTPSERSEWVRDAQDRLEDANAIADGGRVQHAIRDARQLLEDPVIAERQTTIRADRLQVGGLDD